MHNTIFDNAINQTYGGFGWDAETKRAATETQLIKVIADILNSKSTDWPEHNLKQSAPVRFMDILSRARAGLSASQYDPIGARPVAAKDFVGFRFYGTGSDGQKYHILNLSYAALERWYQQ